MDKDSKEKNILNFCTTKETTYNNLFVNNDYNYDQNSNSSDNLFCNFNIFEENLPSIPIFSEEYFSDILLDESSKNKSSSPKEKEENKIKINNQKKKTNKNTTKSEFLIQNSIYLRSGNKTRKKSHRGSNCKNKILRNLIQDIFIDWSSKPNNKKNNKTNIRQLKKLSKKYLEVFYKNYIHMKNITLKEIYSGDCFTEILEGDKHIFEHNKKAIEKSKYMENKLDCTFKQAFKYFYNKENDIVFHNNDILDGLKSKNEYIKEKGEKEFLEKYIEELYNNINH